MRAGFGGLEGIWFIGIGLRDVGRRVVVGRGRGEMARVVVGRELVGWKRIDFGGFLGSRRERCRIWNIRLVREKRTSKEVV